MLKVKLCREGAKMPTYATPGAACFDIHAVTGDSTVIVSAHGKSQSDQPIATGLQFEIPEGYALMIYSRSGHGFKFDTRLSNCVGVIDSDYRGEVFIKLTCDNEDEYMVVHHGDRIAQAMLIPVPQVPLVEVYELNVTERGTGGFGSTGR